MQHPDEGTIHAWLDGALSAEEAARIEAHVNECPQCAAAVAEVRGFIAASSRILTALDNVPAGVVPEGRGKGEAGSGMVARSARTRNWMYWRAAAAVLVIAIGTVVVRKEQSGTSRTSTIAEKADTAPGIASPAVLAQGSGAPQQSVTPQQGVAPPAVSRSMATNGLENGPAQTPSSRRNESRVAESGAGAPESSGPRFDATDASRSRITAAPATAGGSASSPAATATMQNSVAVPSAQRFAPPPSAAALGGKASGVATSPSPSLNGIVAGVHEVTTGQPALGAAVFGQPQVRTLSARQVIGGNRTVYEIAPGDTVVLMESLPTQLDQVVTGVAVATTRAATATKTTATPNAEAPQAAAPVSANGQTSQPAPQAVTKRAAPSNVNTIAWTDAKTGHPMQLSGHHTPEELQ
ncbi:MAG TPA: zf-HC2 domain-containing protein, partial [Gemmatimonadaceae bacterium]|nr:zf-HC2 domain-containing protein [Gemmatimonadaceae bacterium]